MGILEGRVALVTGAGRGIGAAVARLLAAEGAAVVVSDLGVALDGSGPSDQPALQVAEEIRRAGGEALPDATDVVDFGACAALVDRAVEAYGHLDVVVTAAGILRDRMLFNLSEADWDAVVAVHLKGTFNVARHAAAWWRAQRNPEGHYRLVTFTSGSGLHGAPGQPNYAAAKMGIVGFTFSCANALGRYGVTANAVAPAAATRMTESIPAERRRGGPGADDRSPERIAPLVCYLASTRSDWLTGQVLSARGTQIGLYAVPQVTRQVTWAGELDLEGIFSALERSFRPAVAGAQASRAAELAAQASAAGEPVGTSDAKE
jgi:NAD(P)-dependent dehydrogenase (short-subunit alcohol dehydrogenase family)